MKVLVCIPCLLTGGTEIQTLSLVEALVAAGHKPIVACYFEHNEGMVQRYEDAGADVRLLSPEGVRPNGVKAISNFLWKKLKQLVKEIKPDVAHVQYMTPGSLPIIMLKLLGIKKIIATTHTDGDIYSKNGLRIIRFLTNNVLSGFQCITERAERSYFGSSRLFDGKISRHFTIYNNIPTHISILSQPRKEKSEKEAIIVGVVSRLESIKGMDLVIPAFAKAYEKNNKLKLLVVGDGSLFDLMKQQAIKENISGNVEFVGLKPQSELQSYYDRIDILLMPSRSEGFGLTAIEGMARGCVPVVSNTGGLPEVVSSGSGLTHPCEDVAAIADAILKASDSLSTLSKGAISRAYTFSKNVYQDSIKRLYNQF